MAKFHKVEAEVEAYQLPVDPTEDDNQAFHAWADKVGLTWESDRDGAILIIHQNFGPLPAHGGDWIVAGTAENDFYPVNEADFASEYAPSPKPKPTGTTVGQVESACKAFLAAVAEGETVAGEILLRGSLDTFRALFTPLPPEPVDYAGLRCRVQSGEYSPFLIFEDANGDTTLELRTRPGPPDAKEPPVVHELAAELVRRWVLFALPNQCARCNGERFVLSRKLGVEIKAWGDDILVRACPKCNADYDVEADKAALGMGGTPGVTLKDLRTLKMSDPVIREWFAAATAPPPFASADFEQRADGSVTVTLVPHLLVCDTCNGKGRLCIDCGNVNQAAGPGPCEACGKPVHLCPRCTLLNAKTQCDHLYQGNVRCHRRTGHDGDHHCDGTDIHACILGCATA